MKKFCIYVTSNGSKHREVFFATDDEAEAGDMRKYAGKFSLLGGKAVLSSNRHQIATVIWWSLKEKDNRLGCSQQEECLSV